MHPIVVRVRQMEQRPRLRQFAYPLHERPDQLPLVRTRLHQQQRLPLWQDLERALSARRTAEESVPGPVSGPAGR
jgi:hypothetical protein